MVEGEGECEGEGGQEGVKSQPRREECSKMDWTQGLRQTTLFGSPSPSDYFYYSKI